MADIDTNLFAQDCIRQALYCGVNPHYLLAVAKMRSDLKNDEQGKFLGVFRVTQEEWNAHCTDTEFDFNFLPVDIKDWDMQVPVFALMVHRAFDTFVLAKKRNPSAKELYLQQWPDADAAAVSRDLATALTFTSVLLGPAADAILEKPTPRLEIDGPNAKPQLPSDLDLDLSSISTSRRRMAVKIQSAFNNAGMGVIQQAAAIANAIAESESRS